MQRPSAAPPAELWAKAEAEERFWEAQYSRLLAECPDQFAAASDGQIVACGPNLETVLSELSAKGIPLERASLRFIATDPGRFLL